MCKTRHTVLIQLFIAAALLATGSVHGADVAGQLPQAVRDILSKNKIPPESLSLYVKQQGAARPLLEFNADIPRNPASVIKIVTTFAGLELLGPNYTWETHFHLDGRLENGTLNGNLILEGGGDPLLVNESFWHMLHTLQNRGLKHINGNLLIDDELFEDETGTPADFDNRPYHVYNIFPAAALVNFRAHEFHIIPQKNKVHIYADPAAYNMQIRNNVQVVKGKCSGRYNQINMSVIPQGSQTVIEFNGVYPDHCGEMVLLRSVLSNDDYIYGVFRSLWEGMGGTITGTVGKTSIDARNPFYVVPSRPLSEVIAHINKYSNNVMARQLFLTIGKPDKNDKDKPGTKESARQAIFQWLQGIGISTSGLVIDNGSGLSRTTRITARTLGELLEHASKSPYQPEFFASLPLAGIDGTMRKRLNGKIPAGKVRIKTGLINNVRAMAGYVRSRNNNEYFVVSLQNYPGIQNWIGTQIQDEILEWLYEQK
jgi:serine-type D-Ala-D-Ala carboxypeptidase/endopeptidase (penicillin-binding protein 4)